MTTENSAAKIAELAVEASAGPSTVALSGGREFILHPPSWVAKEVPVLPHNVEMPIPKWTMQTVNLQNEMSITAYVNRFKNADTVLFADIDNNKVVAVIDYHHEAVTATAAEGTPALGFVAPQLKAHKAILSLPHSIEWATWIAKDEEEMNQLEFVSFLEDNAVDIRAFGDNKLDGTGLKELCADIEGTRNVKFGASIRSGSADNIEYTKESGVQTKGKLVLPQTFGLSIPVYFGDDEVQMTAMLRRRIGSEGQLTLWYKLLRPENIRQNRFQQIVQRIEIETDHLTTIYGTAG